MPATASAVLVVGDDEFFNWDAPSTGFVDITCDSVEQNIIRGDLKEPSCLVVGFPRKLVWSIRRRARLVHEMEYLTVAVIEMVCSTLNFVGSSYGRIPQGALYSGVSFLNHRPVYGFCRCSSHEIRTKIVKPSRNTCCNKATC